jgi:dipeptidyl aminopeptidase/acylaminoacyl peptidase
MTPSDLSDAASISVPSRLLIGAAAVAACVAAAALLSPGIAFAGNGLHIPAVSTGEARAVTVSDISSLRYIDTLSLSPDGERYAIFVRQPDPRTNTFGTGWFVGSTRGGALMRLGDGGDIRYDVDDHGLYGGNISGRESRWSPDGRWIAYVLERDGEVQLWRSPARGGKPQQLTRSAGNVREFSWSEDGRLIYYAAEPPRAERAARREARARVGYRYDHDMIAYTDFLMPEPRPVGRVGREERIVRISDRKEWAASEDERETFARLQRGQYSRHETIGTAYVDAASPPVPRSDGASAWLTRLESDPASLRVTAALTSGDGAPLQCSAEQCAGAIVRLWWSANEQRVIFWRAEGINRQATGFYAWDPRTDRVATLYRTLDESLRKCQLAHEDRLVCIRDSSLHPHHLALIDLRTGAATVLADVNPEFRNIRLGKVERFEWDTPPLAWNLPGSDLAGLYPSRTYGYIYYPADFDPNRTYPVFIDPYVASGFSAFGTEHALHVYAANGIMVLRTEFPPTNAFAMLGDAAVRTLYDPERNFPHLTMYMESTIAGLEAVAARGFIARSRVGIGGVSHGTFVPLFMLQNRDVITAISISSSYWEPNQYYFSTLAQREALRRIYGGSASNAEWLPAPEADEHNFWDRINIANHVDEIEAPILMNLAVSETHALVRLIRRLRDTDHPYDAYIFPNETHEKWQPAHIDAIMRRNLDWFRFWLQDIEDPDSAKAEQYERWRQLRELQCRNPRSLRNYCDVASAEAAPGR